MLRPAIDLRKYHFSVVYSFDVHNSVSVNELKPPHLQKHEWRLTESGSAEFDKRWKHRKYGTVLTFEQLREFVEHCVLTCTRIQTMGTLGAPGLGLGIQPAVSFDGEREDALQNAYVTPIPPCMMSDRESHPLLPGMPEDIDMPRWEDVEETMWDWFASGNDSATEYVEELEEMECTANA